MSGVSVSASFNAVVIFRFHVVQSTCETHDVHQHRGRNLCVYRLAEYAAGDVLWFRLVA